MKTTIAMLIGVISLGCATLVQAQTVGGSAKQAVTAAEEQWTQAERTNTPDSSAPLLAEKYLFIDTDGTISNRAKYLADSKATQFASVDIQDLKITVIGHTAVAIMVFKAKGTFPNKTAMDIHARWADTWVKMPDGKWQCVLSQGSDLKK